LTIFHILTKLNYLSTLHSMSVPV